MIILFLILSLTFGLFSLGTILSDFFHTKDKGEIQVSGHDTLVIACFALLRIAKRKLAHFRRLFLAYLLHLSVRILRIFDKVTFLLYAKSRELFIKNAVKNKGTVPFFWEYLKTYKQEIDRERELLLKDEE